MEELFSSVAGAIEIPKKLPMRCDVEFEFDKQHLPKFITENGQ
jgi:hypothetical protein